MSLWNNDKSFSMQAAQCGSSLDLTNLEILNSPKLSLPSGQKTPAEVAKEIIWKSWQSLTAPLPQFAGSETFTPGREWVEGHR